MSKKESYIETWFKIIVSEEFPEINDELLEKYSNIKEKIFFENQNASKELMMHLESKIVPAIAMYQTLISHMEEEKLYNLIHEIVHTHAIEKRKSFEKILKIPFMYSLVPTIFRKVANKSFNENAGFKKKDISVSKKIWRIDMIKCPYKDFMTKYNCPNLCQCFCDSDDTVYEGLHKNLIWERTKTLGRGNDCCDFCIKLKNN